MTRFALNSATRSMDIIVNGVVVESIPTSMPLSYREERLKAHGYVSSTPTRREQIRQEQRGRGRNNGYGFTRSSR